jgi:hypothetical protein
MRVVWGAALAMPRSSVSARQTLAFPDAAGAIRGWAPARRTAPRPAEALAPPSIAVGRVHGPTFAVFPLVQRRCTGLRVWAQRRAGVALGPDGQRATELAEIAGIPTKGVGNVLFSLREQSEAERRDGGSFRYVWRRARSE